MGVGRRSNFRKKSPYLIVNKDRSIFASKWNAYSFYDLLNKKNGRTEEEKTWEWRNNIKKAENVITTLEE